MQLTLMGSLVHLRLGIALTYVDVALVLFNCCKLETLEIDYVDSDRGNEGLSRNGVQGLLLSAENLPQRLKSASFGLVPHEVDNGFAGLATMLSLCENLNEISVYPQSESREIPVELIVTPTQFSSKLVPDSNQWTKLTSFFFHLPTTADWSNLKSILPRLTSLSTLYLLVDAENPVDDADAENAANGLADGFELAAADDDDQLNRRRIENLHLRISNSQSLLFLRRVLRYWSSISNLFVSIPYGEMLMDEVDFH